LILPQKAESGK